MEIILIGGLFCAFVLATAIFLTIPFSSWLASLVDAIDLPGKIKIHTRPMPRLGGLGILLAFAIALGGLFFFVTIPDEVYGKLVVLLTSLGLLAICGYLDDVYGLSAIVKFVAEEIVAIVFISCVMGSETNWLILAIACFWIVGLINAYNFIDGMDGLAAGLASLNLFTLAILLLLAGNNIFAMVSLTMALATCGFLRYNMPPATIFMGDTGSLSLGFLISALSCVLIVDQSYAFSSIVAVALAAILPLGDLIATILRRLVRGKSLFKGDREHFYDILVDKVGLSRVNTVYLSLLVTFVLSSLGILMSARTFLMKLGVGYF